MDISQTCLGRAEGIGARRALGALKPTPSAQCGPTASATVPRLERIRVCEPPTIDARDQRTLASPVALYAIPA